MEISFHNIVMMDKITPRSREAILTQPVAMRRAEFWIVWSFWTRDGDVLGNQMGTAYMKKKTG